MTEAERHDKIAAWHHGEGEGKELHEYLEMSWEDYKRWVEAGDSNG